VVVAMFVSIVRAARQNVTISPAGQSEEHCDDCLLRFEYVRLRVPNRRS
jgi:hypothetical protein